MSASLVGSEMCIRDRPNTATPGCHLQRCRMPKSPIAQPLSRMPYSTVSYTHLTLPTICSV
eukprot:14436467-Alexandrium_andersonii.AAC.1